MSLNFAEKLQSSGDGSKRLTAAAKVYGALRKQIIALELAPGALLSRSDVADQYGVSQSPVREAIQRLEQEGMVICYPQSRTVVTKIDVDHARETQFLRIAVELEVTNTLAQNTDPEILLSAKRILRMQKMAGEDKDISEFTALDRLFHMALFEAAGVPALWHVVAGRSGQIDRLRHLNLPDPGKMMAVLQHHDTIIGALSAGDRTATETAVRAHLSGTLEAVPQIKARYPEYF